MFNRGLARVQRHTGLGRFVRRSGPAIVGVWIVLIGATMTAQGPAFSADDLDKAMKTLDAGFTLVKHALATNDVENAKDYLLRSRELLATSVIFWNRNKKSDAVQMLRTALKAMDDLDPLL